jgi:hypothetical protein
VMDCKSVQKIFTRFMCGVGSVDGVRTFLDLQNIWLLRNSCPPTKNYCIFRVADNSCSYSAVE